MDDLIIAAAFASPNGNSSGESCVVFGSSNGFASSLELSALTGGNGFVLNGVTADDFSGFSASGAGDINGDGVDDLIIGAYGADPNESLSGENYVVFGASSGFAASLELSALDGSNGFVLNGIALNDFSGVSVSGAGDINGDGVDDLIIGADHAEPNGINSGESYVVFGASSGFASSLELSALDGSNGFVLNGITTGDQSGKSVSGAGDINGDGVDDLIIGAYEADPHGNNSGESYVVFGSSSGFASSLELSALDGSNGFVLNGINSSDRSGRSVSGAGDINGDGVDDLIIGARDADPNGSGSGQSYVVFGSSSGFASSLELSALTGGNGFVLNGIILSDNSGQSVSGAGDINGDGVDDLIIGAFLADPNGIGTAGESYVVFGASSGFASSLELSALDGSNGFVLNGIIMSDRSGISVSGAGDINGDGVDDLIIGAYDADPNGMSGAGESYVVFGSSSGFASSLELSALTGGNGFVLNGIAANDSSGFSVSGAGDINGDGADDLIIGARTADPNGNSTAGESYVVFGSSSGFAASLELSALDGSNGFVLNGITVHDYSGASVSGAGDINGDGVDDLIIGAYYADPNAISNAGESYVVFGSSSGFASVLELSALDGSNGFVLNGIDGNDRSGRSVSGAGDIDGDGVADLIIGAYRAGPNGNSTAGESYVVFGEPLPTTTTTTTTTAPTTTTTTLAPTTTTTTTLAPTTTTTAPTTTTTAPTTTTTAPTTTTTAPTTTTTAPTTTTTAPTTTTTAPTTTTTAPTTTTSTTTTTIPAAASLRLQKTWSGSLVFDEISASTDGLSIEATLFSVASGAIIDNDPGEPVAVSVGDIATLEAEVFEEGDSDNYITSDWECDDDAESTVAPGGTLEIMPADADSDITCTVTNTFAFFEGIPSLSQFGRAIMALLMLAVGVVGFRRFR